MCARHPGVDPSLDITDHMRDVYEDLHIDAHTCVSHYTGGGIDWDMTVSGLMNGWCAGYSSPL